MDKIRLGDKVRVLRNEAFALAFEEYYALTFTVAQITAEKVCTLTYRYEQEEELRPYYEEPADGVSMFGFIGPLLYWSKVMSRAPKTPWPHCNGFCTRGEHRFACLYTVSGTASVKAPMAFLQKVKC